MRSVVRMLSRLAFALGLAPAVVLAQSGGSAEASDSTFVLHGVVVDADAGTPLSGVGVHLSTGPATWTHTDGAGRFGISGVPPGWAQLRAERLGYEELEAEVRTLAGDTLLLRMAADPHEAEALRGVLAALDRRMTQGTVVVEGGRIAEADPASVLEIATTLGGIQVTPCGRPVRSAQERSRVRGPVAGGGDTCAVAAGRLVDTRVWVDEERDYGGLEALADLPADGIWRVEVHPWWIRVYTSAFMEWAVLTDYRPRG